MTMPQRDCVRGCTVEGLHFATCPDFGRGAEGDCKGCVRREAREGALLCDRCYGRLRRRIEAVPDLVAHLRSLAGQVRAQTYDQPRVQGSGPTGSPAPVPVDVLDAVNDIMQTVSGRQMPAGVGVTRARMIAYTAVSWLLDAFDVIANDETAALEWWANVMADELPDRPEFWTIAKALARWPMEDRRKRAQQACPDCGLKAVWITPPRHRHARTWFECEQCGWRKTELDDEGLWAAAFGMHAEQGSADEGSNMAGLGIRDLEVGPAISDALQYVLDHQAEVAIIGPLGIPTAAVTGAIPALAEQFALIAEQVASSLRRGYENGDLLAGGARLVAAAIRKSVQGGGFFEDLVAELETAPESAEPEAVAA